MKQILTMIAVLLTCVTAQAQHGAMTFAGPSTFGIESMNAWQENETDTISFEMTSMSEANITLPPMTYNAMGMTIPSFTIHGAKFDFDYTTRDAVFNDQTFTETVTVDGAEKTITGHSLTASYTSSTQTFVINAKFSYGKMPLQVTYKIDAKYVVPTGIEKVLNDRNAGLMYDLVGRLTDGKGGVYIRNGKKYIKK